MPHYTLTRHQRLALFTSENRACAIDFACLLLLLILLLILLLCLVTAVFGNRNKNHFKQKRHFRPLPMAQFANDALPRHKDPSSPNPLAPQSAYFRPGDAYDTDPSPTSPVVITTAAGHATAPRRSRLSALFNLLRPHTLLQKARTASLRRRIARTHASAAPFEPVDYSGRSGRYIRWARRELAPVPASPLGTPDFAGARREFQRVDGDRLYDEVFDGNEERLRTYLDLEGDFPEGARAQVEEEELELLIMMMGDISLGYSEEEVEKPLPRRKWFSWSPWWSTRWERGV